MIPCQEFPIKGVKNSPVSVHCLLFLEIRSYFAPAFFFFYLKSIAFPTPSTSQWQFFLPKYKKMLGELQDMGSRLPVIALLGTFCPNEWFFSGMFGTCIQPLFGGKMEIANAIQRDQERVKWGGGGDPFFFPLMKLIDSENNPLPLCLKIIVIHLPRLLNLVL